MTKDTEKLIERLAEVVKPVRPLARPWIRTAAWLLVALPYVALVVFVVLPREDLISKTLEWRYVVEQVAALATGITAATAAFATVIPRYDRRVLFLPMIPVAIWLGSLGQGCVQDWIPLSQKIEAAENWSSLAKPPPSRCAAIGMMQQGIADLAILFLAIANYPLVRVNRDAGDVHPAALEMDEEQDVVGHQPAQR
jgi:hypothetical protein